MPTKKDSLPSKGKKGNIKGKKDRVSVGNGGDTNEMSKAQLERMVTSLRQELAKAQEERNFYQLERDKLVQFWEITRQQLCDARGELRVVDRKKEEKEEEHQRSITVSKLMGKYLIHEHLCEAAEMQAEKMASLEASQKKLNEQEQALLRDKRIQKELLLEMQQQHQDEIRGLKMELAEKISHEREQLKKAGQDLEESYKERFKQQQENLTIRFNMEVAEIEERKNRQIAELKRNHDSTFDELKTYYNDITLNQLSLISSLKEQMTERKMSEERMAMTLKKTQKWNNDLVEPLKQAQRDAAEFEMQLMNYQKDKQCLTATKKLLSVILKEMDILRWQRETLLLQSEKLIEERGEVGESMKLALLEEQQKTGIRTVLLEGKVQVLKKLLMKRETQCAELIHAIRLHPDMQASVSAKVEEVTAN